jgi:DNA polymerase delta subunit 4
MSSKQPSITDHGSIISKKKRTVTTEKKSTFPSPTLTNIRKVQVPEPVAIVDSSGSREIEAGVTCTQENAETELRSFDICTRYGPCMSLTRVQRFERAKRFGLNPPERIGKILHAFPELSVESIWHGRT